ncbi:MAG: dienelactone hydrolase family protein, partial [Gammaproteobacteria bacterium]
LEFLGDFAAARAPVNLEQRPALADFGPRAAILYYPYCGRGPRAPAVAYPTATRTIIFHGTADGITSPAQCRSRTAALKALGANVEFVALPAVRHGFDNHAQTQVFDGKATALSTAMAAVILEQAMAPSSSPGEP